MNRILTINAAVAMEGPMMRVHVRRGRRIEWEYIGLLALGLMLWVAWILI